MKQFTALLSLSLMFAAGNALAADQAKAASPTPQAMDHGKMDMSHGQMDHGAMDHAAMTHDEFAMLDKNHDGKLSKAEIAADSHLAPHFGMLDTDRNGALSRAEYAKGDGM
jgi:uncharacterized protein involved in copper resistance